MSSRSTQVRVPVSSADDPTSRYVMLGSTEEFTPGFLDWWERDIIPPALDDIPFTINKKYSRRPDLLAADVYGKDKMQTLILQYNTITDVNTQFVDGETIILVSPERALSLT